MKQVAFYILGGIVVLVFCWICLVVYQGIVYKRQVEILQSLPAISSADCVSRGGKLGTNIGFRFSAGVPRIDKACKNPVARVENLHCVCYCCIEK